ncbi:M48 family metallopeptidase [Nesterenkonia sp. CL21]|uniref:M48 metallopeptidase family protein n=1 Tax=Nesterenkonia sp. CL21 TaxID=3064894 RepID=UPI00287AB5DF|nr:M48 family metallopeptidase [Nesterenkonia sp. CL21]MDS2171169.1 M48 family metallopeptidase [Nesterenkonia sp. CL21]
MPRSSTDRRRGSAGPQDAQRIMVDGDEVLVIRSPRRTRTVTADQLDGTLRLRVPSRLSRAQVDEHARAFQQKLRRRAEQRRRTDEELMRRALELSREHLDDIPRPTSVVWSDRQTTRWGSTTSTEGTIRLSSRLQKMPLWVQDAVLVHELAHLIEPGHGPRFQALVARYPRTREADAFLEGVSFAWSHPQ